MQKIIIGIIGENASGKTTATEYLIKQYGAVSFRFSDPLADVLKRLYLENSRANLQKLSTLLRQNFDEEILSAIIAKDAKNSPANLIITEGVRRPGDITHLKQLDNFYLIALDAAERVRYERLIKRAEKTDDATKTWESFQIDGQQEAEQKIKQVATQANFKIDNNNTLEGLFSQLDDIILKIQNNPTQQ